MPVNAHTPIHTDTCYTKVIIKVTLRHWISQYINLIKKKGFSRHLHLGTVVISIVLTEWSTFCFTQDWKKKYLGENSEDCETRRCCQKWCRPLTHWNVLCEEKILFAFISPMWAQKTDTDCEHNSVCLPSSKLRWWLSGYCHILLSNLKLCIQFGQPTGSPIAPDFKAWIMTLKGQLKQASLFFYSGAYAAGNPLKSSIDSLSYPKHSLDVMTNGYPTSEPLHQGCLLKTGPIFNTMLIKSEYS